MSKAKKKFILKFSKKAQTGNKVSHAKNRSKRTFKRNLHSATVVMKDEDGNPVKRKVKVPTKVLRKLKQAGLTTHHKAPKAKAESRQEVKEVVGE